MPIVKSTMTIENGFKIDEPDIFVPWGIEENALVDLFQGKDLKKMAAGYHTICAQSLSGLKCQLGFHFEPRRNGKLKELEFFRTNYDNQKKSYDEFQKYFVMSFGTPTKTTKGTEGFKNHQWTIGRIEIVHFVYDRFGPEEHMRIKCA